MAAREIPRKRRAGRTPPPERRDPAPGEKARASVAAAGADAPDGPDPGAGGTASFPPGLYIVPTPLGNMGDMSPRAVTALRKSALAASEDTRRTAKLLNFLGISLPQVSYREQSHAAAWPRVRDALARGLSVALMTDAGSPGVSDPGAALAAAARAGGFAV
ncbi:MAG: hypothetical protein LBQ12_15310, partial [Deltaproteobacteria bacterium]|nr:hypothetical protein [Deltaproteobacteria bacterium]